MTQNKFRVLPKNERNRGKKWLRQRTFFILMQISKVALNHLVPNVKIGPVFY